MTNPLPKVVAVATFALAGVQSASAHIGYTNRNFGILEPGVVAKSVTIGAQTVTSDFGWADGTDGDFGDSHKTRAFRFTLANPGSVMVTVSGAAGGTRGAALLPAFSIYFGLAHIAPAVADHDFSDISQDYLLSLGGVAKEGCFVALGDWKVGNETSVAPFEYAELSSFAYLANAADGNATNYGSASGIHGDGVADGTVSGTFYLSAAGDYSMFVGGALYGGTDVLGTYGITTTIGVVPEPGSILLIGLAGFGVMVRRRSGLWK
ncbi:MAG: PEP-CTERM sorting domain-containing protein [Verrucomicrobiota bacterium]